MPNRRSEKPLSGNTSPAKTNTATPQPNFRSCLSAAAEERYLNIHEAPFSAVYSALVTDIADPEQRGRVKIRLSWPPDPLGSHYEAWARVATLMAGNQRGTWFMPEIDDEMLIAFESGDPRRPCVLGALWNGQDQPPRSIGSGSNNDVRVIRTRSGLEITLDDSHGEESITLETPGGQKLELRDGPDHVEISNETGNTIKLETTGINVEASAQVTISATTINISAELLNFSAPLIKCNDTIQAVTVITDNVVAKTYTPGAGNIW